MKFSCTQVKVGLLYWNQTDFLLSSRFKIVDLLYQFFCQNCCFYFFKNYICATPMVWAYFWHLTAKLIFMSNFWEVDILNHKMRLSLYIVRQSNMIQCCRGFFFIQSCIKRFFFVASIVYFKSHNKNYIVCSLYHHAFHNSIFFFVYYTINFLWILFFLEVDVLLLEFRKKKNYLVDLK